MEIIDADEPKSVSEILSLEDAIKQSLIGIKKILSPVMASKAKANDENKEPKVKSVAVSNLHDILKMIADIREAINI